MIPPEKEKTPATRSSGGQGWHLGDTISPTAPLVNGRFCRPVAVADIARQIFEQLRQRFESGSDFEARRMQCRDAAEQKQRTARTVLSGNQATGRGSAK